MNPNVNANTSNLTSVATVSQTSDKSPANGIRYMDTTVVTLSASTSYSCINYIYRTRKPYQSECMFVRTKDAASIVTHMYMHSRTHVRCACEDKCPKHCPTCPKSSSITCKQPRFVPISFPYLMNSQAPGVLEEIPRCNYPVASEPDSLNEYRRIKPYHFTAPRHLSQ